MAIKQHRMCGGGQTVDLVTKEVVIDCRAFLYVPLHTFLVPCITPYASTGATVKKSRDLHHDAQTLPQ
jgi:hypothetical protein